MARSQRVRARDTVLRKNRGMVKSREREGAMQTSRATSREHYLLWRRLTSACTDTHMRNRHSSQNAGAALEGE